VTGDETLRFGHSTAIGRGHQMVVHLCDTERLPTLSDERIGRVVVDYDFGGELRIRVERLDEAQCGPVRVDVP
jgi:hypothetical protein